MIALRPWFVVAAAIGAISFAETNRAASEIAPLPKPRPAAVAKLNSEVRVYLLRGLLNVFSLGMDDLAEKLTQRGIKASVSNHNDWSTLANEIAEDYSKGNKGPVVLIGHSLGADAVILMAEYLDKKNIPVSLVVPFDPTASDVAPKNVEHLLNLYQHNGWGHRVTPGPGFHGELSNVDLTKDESIGHGSIDKSPRLHELVIEKILQVAAKSRPPRKPRAPAAPATPVASRASLAGPATRAHPATAVPAQASPHT
jgi:hypothetical protein